MDKWAFTDYDTTFQSRLCSCRCLSTFKVCRWGEARAWSTNKIENLYSKVKRSELFDRLPDGLSEFDGWLPCFQLLKGPPDHVFVALWPRSTSTAQDLEQWKQHSNNLQKLWWKTIFIPALQSLPRSTRTWQNNTVHTWMVMGILPRYVDLDS